MKVLAASSTDTQAHTVRGELLVLPPECDREDCDCRRRWLGLGSGQTCLVATVVDRPDLTADDLVDMLAATLQQTTPPNYTEADARADAAEVIDEVLAIAAHYPPGARLRRTGDETYEDATPNARLRRRGWRR